jgi:hypothetical protein
MPDPDGSKPMGVVPSDAEAVIFLVLPLPLLAKNKHFRKRFRFQICFQFCFSICKLVL